MEPQGPAPLRHNNAVAQAGAEAALLQPPPEEGRLTLNIDPVKYLEHIRIFAGNKNELDSFIKRIDIVSPLILRYDRTSQNSLLEIIKDKLEGKARELIQAHPHLESWEQIKNLLRRSFGCRHTVYQLYDALKAVQCKQNILDFYNEIQMRLSELNRKCYEEQRHDDIPHNFTIALEVFKDKVRDPARQMLYCCRPNSLEEALNFLSQAGYLKESDREVVQKPRAFEVRPSFRPPIPPRNNFNASRNNSNPQYRNQNQNNFTPRVPPRNYNNNFQNYPRNNNFQNNYPRDNYQNNYNPRNRNNESLQYANGRPNNPFRNNNNNPARPTPMEVDTTVHRRINELEESRENSEQEEQTDFRSIASETHPCHL